MYLLYHQMHRKHGPQHLIYTPESLGPLQLGRCRPLLDMERSAEAADIHQAGWSSSDFDMHNQ
jgi:hypothetical protein